MKGGIKIQESDREKIRSIIIEQIEYFGRLVLAGEYVTAEMCGYADTVCSLIQSLRMLEEC